MKKTKYYISPELDFLQLTDRTVLCTSDVFGTEQNEAINENDYIW